MEGSHVVNVPVALQLFAVKRLLQQFFEGGHAAVQAKTITTAQEMAIACAGSNQRSKPLLNHGNFEMAKAMLSFVSQFSETFKASTRAAQAPASIKATRPSSFSAR
jgi:hypothetical protein